MPATRRSPRWSPTAGSRATTPLLAAIFTRTGAIWAGWSIPRGSCRQERPGSSCDHFSVGSGRATDRAVLLRVRYRQLPVGHPGQGRGHAGLSFAWGVPDKVRAYAVRSTSIRWKPSWRKSRRPRRTDFERTRSTRHGPNNGVDYKLDIEVCQGRPQGRRRRLPAADRPGGRLHARGGHEGRPRYSRSSLRRLRRPPPDDRHGRPRGAVPGAGPAHHIGEFIFSPYDYADYIRRGALDVVRFIVDNIGGISGGMKVARLAECSAWSASRTTGARRWTTPSTSTASWPCRTTRGSK